MTRWIVFEPPSPTEQGRRAGSAPPARTDRAVFVRDAFARWAVLFPFLWLFRHGLFVSGGLVLAACVSFGLLVEAPGLGPAAVLLPLLLGVLVALEGPMLRARELRRRGFTEAAVVDALDEEEAEILYYAGQAGARDGDAVPDIPAAPAPPTPRFDRGAFFESRMLRAEGRSLLGPQRAR